MAGPSKLQPLARGVLATTGFRRNAARQLSDDEIEDLARVLSDDPEVGEPFEAVPSLLSVGCGANLQARAVYLLVQIETVRFVVLLDVIPKEAPKRFSGPDLERILQLCDTITKLALRALEWLEHIGFP